jgi:hypothetical protein
MLTIALALSINKAIRPMLSFRARTFSEAGSFEQQPSDVKQGIKK